MGKHYYADAINMDNDTIIVHIIIIIPCMDCFIDIIIMSKNYVKLNTC